MTDQSKQTKVPSAFSQPGSHVSVADMGAFGSVNPEPQRVLEEATTAALPALRTPDHMQETLLDGIGVPVILELIAYGMVPEEIAATYGFRIPVLKRWLDQHATQEEISEAKKSAASLYRARAVRSMEKMDTKTATAAQVAAHKLKAEVYTRMSEAMDPAVWNPRTPMGDGDLPLSVVFNIADVAAPGGVRSETDPTTLRSVNEQSQPVGFAQLNQIIGDQPRDAETPDLAAEPSSHGGVGSDNAGSGAEGPDEPAGAGGALGAGVGGSDEDGVSPPAPVSD